MEVKSPGFLVDGISANPVIAARLLKLILEALSKLMSRLGERDSFFRCVREIRLAFCASAGPIDFSHYSFILAGR